MWVLKLIGIIAICGLATCTSTDSLNWIDATELGLCGSGFPPSDKPYPYSRLPVAAKNVVRTAVWDLSLDSAGMFVSFQSNATLIYLNYTLVSSTLDMYHMPMTGVSGVDLYTLDDSSQRWRWVATFADIAYPLSSGPLTSNKFLCPKDGSLRPYIMYLPLYNGVTSMSVGWETSASLVSYIPDFVSQPPIIWYGTSIAQGGVASRPGMAFTNIISRAIQRPIYNFGFSGNGEMELSVAQFLVQIQPPAERALTRRVQERRVDASAPASAPIASAFIIDCNHNMNAAMVANRTVPLVTYIRAQPAFATVPIVLVEGTPLGYQWLFRDVNKAEILENAALRQAYNTLLSTGVGNLFYVTADDLYAWSLDSNEDTPTVDGTHPTDLGMAQIAAFYQSFLPSLF